MQLLLKIFTNPFGVAINIVHWAIVIFAYCWQGNLLHTKTYFIYDSSLLELLMFLNLIPLIIANIIAYPLNALSGKTALVDIHLIFALIIIIISQWSLVGFAINFLIDFHKPEKVKISFE